jgi:hypothetical protein
MPAPGMISVGINQYTAILLTFFLTLIVSTVKPR